MKEIFIFCLLLALVSTECRADAGFSIRRRHAPTQISFEGTSALKGYTLVRINKVFADSDWRHLRPLPGKLDTIDDRYNIYVQDGGRRWEESDRDVFVGLQDSTGRITDSFHFNMKKYNYHLKITGVSGGKLQYNLKKKKAVYSYAVTGDEHDGSDSDHRVNRWIFIGTSLLGLLALVYLFMRRKKWQVA